MRHFVASLGGLAVILLLPALAFAQKAPSGEVGISAPEMGLLWMVGAVAAPMIHRTWRKGR